MVSLFEWIQATAVARATAESVAITASLSAIHLLGFTLVTGGALIGDLKLLGKVFPQCSIAEVLGAANRAIVIGLTISLSTGFLLFSARATVVSANPTFQLKMLLLLTAAAFHFLACRRGQHVRTAAGTARARAGAAVSLSLWMALAVTACAFVLLE